MTIFFKALKENNSVAKTLTSVLQNYSDYNIDSSDIESAMKHIRLSDLLSLNDAVEENDMNTILDILGPHIPGLHIQANERLSPTHATGRNTGNNIKQSRETVPMQPTGTTGYSSAFSDKGAIAGGRKEMRAVAGKGAQGKQPTGVAVRNPADMPTASVTKADGTIIPADKRTSDKIDRLLKTAGLT